VKQSNNAALRSPAREVMANRSARAVPRQKRRRTEVQKSQSHRNIDFTLLAVPLNHGACVRRLSRGIARQRVERTRNVSPAEPPRCRLSFSSLRRTKPENLHDRWESGQSSSRVECCAGEAKTIALDEVQGNRDAKIRHRILETATAYPPRKRFTCGTCVCWCAEPPRNGHVHVTPETTTIRALS